MEPSIKTTLANITNHIADSCCQVYFKNEYEQPSGSFKLRGIGHLISKSLDKAKSENKPVRVFSSSGGNAGLAAAYAAQSLGAKCCVVLPKVSSQAVIDKLKGLDAEVIVQGEHWGQADDYLRTEVMGNLDDSVYPVYCHPFEHELIWEGHGVMIDEITTQLSPLELSRVKGVICSVGGGGLYNGIVAGLERNQNLSKVPVLAVETKQAPTFTEAISANKVVNLTKVKTLATSLASPYISEKSLRNYKAHKTHVELLDDKDALAGTIKFYDTFHSLIEPACGVAINVALDKQFLLEKAFGSLSKDDIVIVIVCGGSSTSLEALNEYRKLI